MIPYAILPVSSFSINDNKTRKLRLRYEIKYDNIKLHKKLKTKNIKNLKFGLLRFSGFLKTYKT